MSGAELPQTDDVERTLRAVRIPLSGLLGFAELLMQGDLGPVEERQARMIHESGRSLLSLLDGLLDDRKPMRADSIEPTTIDIGHRVRACVDAVRAEAEGKGLVLRCEVDPDLPALADCDPSRLRQVVLSLLSSAIETTESGWVSVCAEPAWNDPCTVAISVTDTSRGGPGEDDLALTICHEIAVLMGGSLSRTSEPGRGARAELRLPVRPRPAGSDGARATVSIARERRRDAPRVLVVEDHEVSQSLALDQLDRIGARGAVAVNGRAALARVAEAEQAGDPFRLVLMDLQMPVMDGFAATRCLRAGGREASTLPILALTADVAACDIAACMASGMQGHLAKPIDLDSLRYAIDRWVPEAGGKDDDVSNRRRWPRAVSGT